jgi:hypothetical protein
MHTVMSNAFPSLPVPFSRVMPLTTAIVGPNTRTFNFSFLLEVQVSLSLLTSPIKTE